MNKLEIEIPSNKEIDWEASAKQKQIVFKDKQLTYEDMCQKLFRNGYCFIDGFGQIATNGKNEKYRIHPSNAKTSHQLECILAKNMLANTARYLNGEWKPDETDLGHFDAYVLFCTPNKAYIGYVKIQDCADNSNVLFKSKELAQQAIEILGEETVKLALEPLY